ncbi:MAG: 3'(2'),5'-bisphosphate nucleotidase CysQ [Candidatus Omnitrophica bacterium]|nr:3'(2'),5'-bisphosphate nucleotidase CysQ [Candidatus Omnitrophota bacterium]MCM8790624.1 3'(2'),5'-bisphosphate nucleotidase CysQ [Candidatus Omnitrophota bacterium]
MRDTFGGIKVEEVITIAREAGEKILDIYRRQELFVEHKEDSSPLTLADKLSHDFIESRLKALYPNIPIVSEEDVVPYEVRQNWNVFWLIDPLDGTREFIMRNEEFTINIALIEDGAPVVGVIGVPIYRDIYYALKDRGAFKIAGDGRRKRIRISDETPKDKIIVAVSRSHRTEELEEYVEGLKKLYNRVEYILVGSSLKFCLIAEGKAHVYPRLGPTMGWDTAAGQLIAEEAGVMVIDAHTRRRLSYNKVELVNGPFIAGSNFFFNNMIMRRKSET